VTAAIFWLGGRRSFVIDVSRRPAPSARLLALMPFPVNAQRPGRKFAGLRSDYGSFNVPPQAMARRTQEIVDAHSF
jgi:hypothetical protein